MVVVEDSGHPPGGAPSLIWTRDQSRLQLKCLTAGPPGNSHLSFLLLRQAGDSTLPLGKYFFVEMEFSGGELGLPE